MLFSKITIVNGIKILILISLYMNSKVSTLYLCNKKFYFAGIGGGPIVVAPGVTVELICTGPDVVWYLNGRQALTYKDCYRLTIGGAGDRNVTATLAINANHTCDAFNVYCRIYREPDFLYIHHTTLIVQG